MSDDPPVTREEFEALQARVRALESALAPPAPPPRPLPPPAPPPAPLPVVRPAVPAPPSAPVAARPGASLETMLGKQFAPRIGAALVFLATLFFLGLAIERGWIGPLAQLGIAAAAALALLGIAAWLTSRKGYGAYPQVLEATAMCMLYATAFVAHALPYYQRETGLTSVGSGLLMAAVGASTVALALWRNARTIAGLGFVLAFLTAGLGWGVLPGLTLAYVAILGTGLALVVAWKGWLFEGTAGSAITGALLFGLVVRANARVHEGPDAWVVAVASLPPAAAFLWLSLARGQGRASAASDLPLRPALAVLTLAWAALVTALAADGAQTRGAIALAWAALAAGLSWYAARRASTVATAYGTGAVILYLLATPGLLRDATDRDFLVTASYALAALALGLALLAARRSTGLWSAALALAGAAAVRAIFVDDRLELLPAAGSGPVGSWQSWATFAALAGALAAILALAPPTAPREARRAAFLGSAAFLTAWAWALFYAPFLTTLYLLCVGAAFVLLAAGVAALAEEAAFAALVLLGIAALKTATYDAHLARPPMPVWLAGVETALVAGLLLTLHHVSTLRRRLARQLDAGSMGAALVGGSAAVVASFAFAYAEGAWVSVLLGGLGVAYLATGFVLRGEATYRYVGFGVLGFVLLRVFAVDLSETDLAIRALVFLVLGGILLGVGFAYARLSRQASSEKSPPPPPAEFEVVDPKG